MKTTYTHHCQSVFPTIMVKVIIHILYAIIIIIIIIIVGSCIALMSVRLDTPGAPQLL